MFVDEEFHVTQSELLCLSYTIAMVCILSHSKQKIKGNKDQFVDCFQSTVIHLPCGSVDMIWYCYWDCHLFLGYWVSSLVCFYLHSNGGMVDVSSSSVQWVFKPSQFDSLANGTKCCLHATGFDLSSPSCCTFPDPSSKKL